MLYFNPIIVLFLTTEFSDKDSPEMDFNPIIVLFLTTGKLATVKLVYGFQSYYSLIFNHMNLVIHVRILLISILL